MTSGFPVVTVHSTARTDEEFQEVWTTSAPVQSDRDGDIYYAMDGETLFCACRVPESATYRDSVRAAYESTLTLVHNLNYPNIFRIWNYVSGINDRNSSGLEIYRDFCHGRAEALSTMQGQWTTRLPAATGIGSLSGGIVIYCLSARTGFPSHFENPHQIPAYRYPSQYGPRSPSFARATMVQHSPNNTHRILYLSGTASVVGHETAHPGDLRRQFVTTMENIETLLQSISTDTGDPLCVNQFRLMKVYVRRSEDMPLVREMLRDALVPRTQLRLVNADICRSDLLLEIEGVLDATDVGHPPT
ncbi:MAG: hypothetical protein BGP03_12715 [Pseudonocardia sp. 73-21]|nr:MAG: hypothetical protein BGP03_12715 [Pseudonocardia sp. 73-21]